jgi:O-glycosyl hydrolase
VRGQLGNWLFYLDATKNAALTLISELIMKNIVLFLSTIIVMTIISFDKEKGQAKADDKLFSESIAVIPAERYQVHEGFGTSLTWWANVIGGWPAAERDKITKLMFDPVDGLGINIVRYNIGGSQASQQGLRSGGLVRSYIKADGTYDWTVDANQRWMLQAAKGYAGNEFIAEAFSNSPPWFMTVTGQTNGNGNKNCIKGDQFDEFADYLAEVVKHFKSHWGINFIGLSPMDEPEIDWGPASEQEGCHWDLAAQEKMLKTLDASLKAKNMSTMITAMDGYDFDVTIDQYNRYSPATKNVIDQINAHMYFSRFTNIEQMKTLRDMAKRDRKRFWQTEVDGSGAEWPYDEYAGGTEPEAIGPALDLSWRIYALLKHAQATAWVFWQPVDDNWPMENVHENWGLLLGNYDYDGSQGASYQPYRTTKKYYAYGQYSKFIRPGFQMIGINHDDTVAFIDRDSGRLVLVTTNHASAAVSRAYDLSAFNTVGSSVKVYRTSANEDLAQLSNVSINNKSFTHNAKETSITTYVIDGVTCMATASGQMDGAITDCRAHYAFDGNTGSVCVPCVVVPGAFGTSQIFALEMLQSNPFSLSFEVDPLTLKAHDFQDNCAANYAPMTGLLNVPCVSVGTDRFDVDMQQRPGGLIFDVTDVR